MPRLRPACAAACLAILLMSALPAGGLAQPPSSSDMAETKVSAATRHGARIAAITSWP